VTERPRGGAARREQARHVAITGRVHQPHGFFQAGHRDQAEDRSEYLGAGDLSQRSHLIEHGRVDEESLLETRDLAPPPFDSGGPSFGDAGGDQFFDPLLAVA
jgi:hypothetical protein